MVCRTVVNLSHCLNSIWVDGSQCGTEDCDSAMAVGFDRAAPLVGLRSLGRTQVAKAPASAKAKSVVSVSEMGMTRLNLHSASTSADRHLGLHPLAVRQRRPQQASTLTL